jgi:RHS repeat-associated protein
VSVRRPGFAALPPRIGGLADATISSGKLAVTGATRYGEAVVEGFSDDYYMLSADVEVSGTNVARVFFHYTDPNNAYFIELDTTAAAVKLVEIVNGATSAITTGAYTTGASVPVKIKVYNDAGAQRIKIWVNGTLRINTTDASHPDGGVAFGGDANFDNVVIGYDTDADDAIDDKVMDESFGSTSVTIAHDKAGNLIDDGTFEYQYDAYNRLVKVRSSVDTDVTYQTSNFDGLGRRIKKDVANSGDLDGTTVFYYDGQGIIETRDGSGNLVSQFVRGLRYIDEVVMVRVKDEGELYVHQDANWNVVGLTDLGGRLVERYVYRPYGEAIVHQLGGYGDYDGDGDVDANDRGEITGLTCGGSNPSGACRVLDLDFDNDCDSSDETVFDSLPHTGTVVHPARRSSLLGQPFAHQGLFLDPEIGTYLNRARQYDPGRTRFVQRDPLALVPVAANAHPEEANLYIAYQANPPHLVDPLGTCSGTLGLSEEVCDVPSWGHAGQVVTQRCCAYLRCDTQCCCACHNGEVNISLGSRPGCWVISATCYCWPIPPDQCDEEEEE